MEKRNNNNLSSTSRNVAARGSETVTPAVIAQLLKCNEEVKIHGRIVKIVILVARIRKVDRSESKDTFIVQDMTGTMTTVKWHYSAEALLQEPLECNAYVQIFGKIIKYHNRNMLLVFKMLPLTDVNQIIFHYLQCINNKFNSGKPDIFDDFSQMSDISSIMDTAEAIGMSSRHRQVLNVIKELDVEEGINKHLIDIALENVLSPSDVQEILDWLCAEGYLYTTIDNEHYKATDSWCSQTNL